MKRERHELPELTWPGKRAPAAAFEGGGPVPALVTVEAAGDPDAARAGGKLVRGDNRAAMRALLPAYAGKVDLVYIDPPFGTGGSFAHTERAGGEGDEVHPAGNRGEERPHHRAVVPADEPAGGRHEARIADLLHDGE